jgi:hypothetical protein
MQRRGWLRAMAFGVALLVGVEAAASSKSHLSVRVNGRVLRTGGKRLTFVYGPEGQLAFISVTASRGVHFNRAINFTCIGTNLTTTPPPVTFPQCSGLYQETKIGRHPSVKEWVTSTGIQATIEAFDGTRARGTFSGTMVSPQGTPPAAVKNGKFDADVQTGAPPTVQ